MRGLPPLQALLLLIALVILGFTGRHYIGMGQARELTTLVTPLSSDSTNAEKKFVEAEIEFVFSTPPLSYSLSQPSDTGTEDKILLRQSHVEENPSYEIIQLVPHQETSYWLDIVWPEDAADGAHHFVQIYISPNHGDPQHFSFFTSNKGMNETFEYNTGEHQHE